MKRTIALIHLIPLLLFGCAPVAPQVMGPPVEPLPFGALLQSPDSHAGTRVRLGGVIVETGIREDGTVLEIYQTRIDQQGRPVDIDNSAGRFLGYHPGLLDSEIYRRGRRITVVGVVRGGETRKLGGRDYVYPVLELKEINLWDERPAGGYVYDPWYPAYPWGPWGFWGWYPWGPYRHYGPYRSPRPHGPHHAYPGRPHYGNRPPGRPHYGGPGGGRGGVHGGNRGGVHGGNRGGVHGGNRGGVHGGNRGGVHGGGRGGGRDGIGRYGGGR